MAKLTLEEKLRTGAVRRWHIVPMAREQTIAEHAYRVTLIAEEILRVCGRFDWNSNYTLNVMRLAFIHDQHEVKTGDIPSPAKLKLQEVAGFDVVAAVERKIDGEYAELAALPGCVEIVALADTLEAMDHLGLYGAGPRAREVWETMYETIPAKVERIVARASLDPTQALAILNICETCCQSAIERGWATEESE